MPPNRKCVVCVCVEEQPLLIEYSVGRRSVGSQEPLASLRGEKVC